MTENQKFNTVNHFAGAKNEHPPQQSAGEQANKLKALVTAAQNGDTQALKELCIMFEPLFRKEMKREIFYNSLGFEEGLSLARLRFIEIIMSYNGADYVHFASYVRCRIHFSLYDAAKKIWEQQTNEAALPAEDGEANISALGEDIIENEKQRKTIKALYFEGYTGKELAEKQKITPAAVSKNHKQALNNLKQNIA